MPNAVAEKKRADKARAAGTEKIKNMSPTDYILDKHRPIPPRNEEGKIEGSDEDNEDDEIHSTDEDDSDGSTSEGEKRGVQADVPAGDLAAKVIMAESTDYKGHPWLERAFKLTRQAQNEYVHDHARTNICTCTHVHMKITQTYMFAFGTIIHVYI